MYIRTENMFIKIQLRDETRWVLSSKTNTEMLEQNKIQQLDPGDLTKDTASGAKQLN